MIPVLRLFVFVSCIVTAPINFVQAKDVIGQSSLGDKAVVLFSDQTWAYTTECPIVKGKLRFCGDAETWMPLEQQEGGLIAATYAFDESRFSRIIYEELKDTTQLIDPGRFKDFVLKQTIEATGGEEGGFRLFDTEQSAVNGHEAITIIFGAPAQGYDYVHSKTLLSRPGALIQLMTTSVASEYTTEQADFHARFLQHIALD